MLEGCCRRLLHSEAQLLGQLLTTRAQPRRRLREFPNDPWPRAEEGTQLELRHAAGERLGTRGTLEQRLRQARTYSKYV